MDPLTALAGALTGLLVGVTGVGGGALMTPILLLLFGVAPMTAIGTDLWFAALTKLAAARLHQRLGLIEWTVVRRLWSGSLPASVAALVLLRFWEANPRATSAITVAIGVAVIVSALGMFAHAHVRDLGSAVQASRSFRAWQAAFTIAAGAGLGVLVTLTSIGAGALGAVLLAYLYPRRLTPPRLVATDIIHAIPLAIFAGAGHLLLGHVNGTLLLNLLVGSIPAVLVGAKLSVRLPHGVTRTILAVVLTIIGLRLLWDVQ